MIIPKLMHGGFSFVHNKLKKADNNVGKLTIWSVEDVYDLCIRCVEWLII